MFLLISDPIRVTVLRSGEEDDILSPQSLLSGLFALKDDAR
jgi:hypothetical protein